MMGPPLSYTITNDAFHWSLRVPHVSRSHSITHATVVTLTLRYHVRMMFLPTRWWIDPVNMHRYAERCWNQCYTCFPVSPAYLACISSHLAAQQTTHINLNHHHSKEAHYQQNSYLLSYMMNQIATHIDLSFRSERNRTNSNNKYHYPVEGCTLVKKHYFKGRVLNNEFQILNPVIRLGISHVYGYKCPIQFLI